MSLAISKLSVHRWVLLLAWFLFFAPFAAAQSSDLDKYGGAKTLKCTKATGWFHTQKIGNRWWLCTPLGNAFFANGVEDVLQGDSTYSSVILGKYGSYMTAGWKANERIQSWGFNTLTTGAYAGELPIGTDSSFPGDHSQPVKLPFTLQIRPALEAMVNPLVWNGSANVRFLSNPVKEMFAGHSPYYTSWDVFLIADYYDSGIGTWLQQDLTVDPNWNNLATSPYFNYMIGFTADDGDQMAGFTAGPDFPTSPSGYNTFNLGMVVATMSPVQTANSHFGWVYTNTGVQSKQALRDFLASKYSTVAALNAAWGSNYTTFNSSGSTVTAEAFATGNGSTLSFSHTLANLKPAPFSVQILVSGTPVAGDVGRGTLFGPNVTASTINYITGAITLTFTTGHAPAAGASITVNYIQNGWQTGTGFMDEDARPAHSWWGDASTADWQGMTTANVNVKSDMNTFLGQMAAVYFKACRTQLKAKYPNVMYLGPDSLSTWGTPPPAPVLKAAGPYLDAFLTASSNVFTRAEMDFIEQNFGDKPFFGSFYSTANPDSALSANPNTIGPSGFATQAARGQGYYNDMVQMLQTAHTTAGNFPYIGTILWQYIDNYSEKLNWGLVTHLDNAYDGHEAAAAMMPCASPLSKNKCGGEQRNYGDAISWVAKANRLWLAYAQSLAGTKQSH